MGTNELNQVAETLDRAARRRRIQFAIMGAILIIVTAAGSTGLILGAMALDKIGETSDYLKECTTPSTQTEHHPCYERNQKATARVVNQLLENQDYNAYLMLCLLSVTPEERSETDRARCVEESRNLAEAERSR